MDQPDQHATNRHPRDILMKQLLARRRSGRNEGVQAQESQGPRTVCADVRSFCANVDKSFRIDPKHPTTFEQIILGTLSNTTKFLGVPIITVISGIENGVRGIINKI